ncbi:type I restriction endonuclease subunit R [Corynebacterium amycolatum]|uniref:type I restriction endonuclease subunit R n=1 Tax=Corynebacterium amycolatum TaxID=43765 RepID=UPI00234DD0DB|nr:DEAD/DEAH box helicase family protein [Corynebacterium amycolatum]MDC7118882.1 DEAD/DEAH box helicase family protein [Corynebacterium amycolatum]
MAVDNPLNEKAFQRLIIDELVGTAEYIERPHAVFDPVWALDEELLFNFLERTQGETLAMLRATYKGGVDATIRRKITHKISTDGLIHAIWNGVDFDGGIQLDLVYPRPSAGFDLKSRELFDANQLSIMEEVNHKDGERIDLVIFLNGLALFTVELKCNTSASGDYRNAIAQYQMERDCRTRLLSPKIGALAHFAMDTNEVYVCAELKGRESFFLPFNQGQPVGEDLHTVTGGNPHNPQGINTSYMWEQIWTKETIFDLLYDFIYIETSRDNHGRKIGERPIFPRYQQIRAVRSVSSDMLRSPLQLNYLIEHSAGSGKTKTIAWLAHKLASLYKPGTDELLYDKVIIATDRKVVDKQLQDAVVDMAKDSGIVRVMDKNKTSADLGKALGLDRTRRKSSYRIVATTLQKFLYLSAGELSGSGKRFVVIIDEAHGSTSGKNMASINAALASRNAPDSSLDELAQFVAQGMRSSSRQANISMVGFTATPTGRTLQQFGRLNEEGKYEAFDLYCMRQAIDEGFILDVTANYITYEAYCKIVKAVDDDPELESKAAKRKLTHMISTAEENIAQKLHVIIEHFTSIVAPTLHGKAKAMIVTAGRQQAARYFLEYQKIRAADMPRLGKYQALVAFTGEVEVDGKTWSEAGLNGFSDDLTADEFDTDSYRLLIVADKYQTGFDQPKLCSMYVDKTLRGVTAVQTLSRLNRIVYDKRTFILDFTNAFEDIQRAFAPYYETTALSDPLTINDVRETYRRLTELQILDIDSVEEYNELLAKEKLSHRDKQQMWSLIDAAARVVTDMEEETADEARRVVRNFIKQYTFLLQVMPFEDKAMHMDYNFCTSLIRAIDAGHGGGLDFDLSDKIKIEGFKVEKSGEYKNERLSAKPELKIAKGTGSGLTETQLEKLSKIIQDWNSRFGTAFDTDIAAGSLVSLQATLAKDPKVQQSARVNSKSSFRHTVEEQTQDALIAGYSQNTEWHKFLLNEDDARRELIQAFSDDIFDALKAKFKKA